MEDKYTRANIANYYGLVEMPGGHTHSLVNTLKRIDSYYNGKFESGEWDEKGNKKLFFNITKPTCDIASKFTDIDTKDVILYATSPMSDWKIWLMQHDLKQWLKENNIGKLLNEINFDYPKYGHVFMKKVNKTWKKVNIQNMRFDPSSQSLETDTWIYEALLMTPRQIKEMKWNNQEGINQLLADKKAKYLIYECYDYNLEGGKKWKRTFKAGVWDYKKGDSYVRGTEALYNTQNEWCSSIILHEDEVDKLPYRELKWEEVPGRRLGFGFAEYLFDNQIAENEAENLERKALYFKALQLWYTRDENIGGKNVFDGLSSGQFLLTPSEINTVPKDNSDLSAYNNTRNRWGGNTSSKTFSTDIARGENLPSRTPLGVANIQAGMLTSYFDGKKENYGLFLRPWFLEDVIPSFKESVAMEHKLTLLTTVDGASKFIQAKAREMVDQLVMEKIKQTGSVPSKQYVDMMAKSIELLIKSKKTFSTTIPANNYDDAKYVFDINLTGEQLDTQSAQTSMMTAMQLVGSNPVIIQNKGTRTMLFKGLEYSGVSPVDLNLINEEVEANPMSPEDMTQGGSISQTKPQGQPTMQTTQTQA